VSPEEQALATVVETLERCGIPYMVTGSVASSYYGRPRSTHDSDVVVDPSPVQLVAFVEALRAAGFYVDAASAREALRHRRPFNVIETGFACKIDLIVRRDRDFSREEFSRRRPVDLTFRRHVSILSPEDAILSKLEWSRLSGGSERQLDDVSGILELNRDLDRSYVDHWAHVLGVDDLWLKVSR